MVSQVGCDIERHQRPPGRLAASLAAIISFWRGLPFLVAGRPKTPLRILCLMAFDTVHVLRYSHRLPSSTLQTLATLLDLGACANDFFDNNCPASLLTVELELLDVATRNDKLLKLLRGAIVDADGVGALVVDDQRGCAG